MTTKPRVQLAAYAEDRPRRARLAWVALAALGAGVVVGVRLAPRAAEPAPVMEAPPTGDAQPAAEGEAESSSIASDAATRPDAGAPVAAAPKRDAGVAKAKPEQETAQAPAVAAAPTAPASPLLATAGAPTSTEEVHAPREVAAGPPASGVLPGRVAYLRCDGLAAKGGRFPCPRDRALERAVWQALRGLARCALLAPGPLELRVEISGAHAPSFELRAQERERERTARACLGAALAGVSTTLRPERMVISFAFELRDDAR